LGLKPVRRHCQMVTKEPRMPSPAVDTALRFSQRLFS
jgi:hypothetical protein